MKKFILFLIIVLIIGVGGFICYSTFFNSKEESNILSIVEKEEMTLDKFTIYGTHLNINGTLEKKYYEDNIVSVKLILKNILDESETELDIDYEVKDNTINFMTSDTINSGINLESLKPGNYNVLLLITSENLDAEEENKEIKEYYSIVNKTEYKKAEYYTITKNNKNNKINIAFGKTTIKEKKDSKRDINFMSINIKETKLPENVYDIVIDPGHGGKDGGAVRGEYVEKDIVLEYGLDLKKSLEKLGLKVLLTRENDDENLGIYTMYGKEGRAVVPNKYKSKYTLSLHINSTDYKMNKGGIELYTSNNINFDLPTQIVDNLVNIAKTTYSPNSLYKEKNGIYVRTFTKSEIESTKNSAIEKGYEPYEITTDTPYLFMIRETGGIMNNAYVDGRNKDYEENPYYKSNITTETYLLELGFINNDTDIKNITNNGDLYVKAITEAYKNFLNL